MTLREVLENIKKSEIYQLKTGETLLGYRVKLFNPNTLQFDYYDFSIETVSKIPNLEEKPIIELVQRNGFWLSEAEATGKIKVLTCETQTQITQILNRVKIVLDYNREEAMEYEM